MRAKAQLTLPEEIRRALEVREGDEVVFTVQEDGAITVQGFVSVPSDQAWFFTSDVLDRKQLTNREAGSEGGSVHGSAKAVFTYLDSLSTADA